MQGHLFEDFVNNSRYDQNLSIPELVVRFRCFPLVSPYLNSPQLEHCDIDRQKKPTSPGLRVRKGYS